MSTGDRTDKVRDEEKRGKACWNDRLLELFIKIAIQEVRDGNRPTTHLNKKGWLNLQMKFNRVANVNYEMKQFKNKWENLKKEWQLWKRLLGQETGLGWNENKKTIEASDEWWERKIREVPAVARFRERGLYMADEMEMVFGDVVATGCHAWTPSFGHLPSNGGGLGNGTQPHSVQLEEGSGDSTDSSIGSQLPDLNLDTPPDTLVAASTYSPPHGQSRRKRKGKRRSDSRARSGSCKKQNSSPSVSMSLDKLAGALVESNRATVGCEECIEVIFSLPIERGSQFFYECINILGRKKDLRVMFMALKDPELQMGYLHSLVDK